MAWRVTSDKPVHASLINMVCEAIGRIGPRNLARPVMRVRMRCVVRYAGIEHLSYLFVMLIAVLCIKYDNGLGAVI